MAVEPASPQPTGTTGAGMIDIEAEMIATGMIDGGLDVVAMAEGELRAADLADGELRLADGELRLAEGELRLVDQTADGSSDLLLGFTGGRASATWHPRLLQWRKPPKIVRGPGVTVHRQIEDWLADAIATGRLTPGDRLPTEHNLAKWLGVSRMTLRHALAELAQRGLVLRTVGRTGGTFVAQPKLEQDFTVLAGFSEQLRKLGLVAGARVLSAAQISSSAAAAAALEIGVGDPVYEVRRLRLAGAQPILIEHSLFPAERCPGLLENPLDGSLYELLEAKYGQRPHRAKESLEPVTAGIREAEALGIPEGAPLMLVERTAYARSGLPLEFAHDLFRGDRTRVVVWTSELAGGL